MRVLYLTDNPNLGATVRILQSWLPLAPSRGVTPLVVTPPGSKFAGWLAEHGVEHTTSPMPWPSKRWPFPGFWHAWRLARWARERRVDLIHCNEHNIYPFCLLLRRFLRLPVVCHVRYRLARDFAAWAFGGTRLPDALLWTSRQQRLDSAEAVAGVVPDDIQHLVYLGLDLGAFGARGGEREAVRRGWGVDTGKVVVGQVTALRPRKRIEDFIALVEALAREDDRVVGVLAGDAPPGDEPYRDQVLRLVEKTGLGPRFRWLGNVDDVEPVHHALDLFVSTSEYETFGNSVCEAMACARPVVAYRGGSVEEVVGDAGRVVANADVAGLIAQSRELLVNEGRREALGRQGRARVEAHFNPSASLDQLVDLYRRLLGGSRPS